MMLVPPCTPGSRIWVLDVGFVREPILNICEIGLIAGFRAKKRVRVSQKAPSMQKKNKS